MGAIRCPDCESFVSLNVDAEVEDTQYDDSSNFVEVDLHLILTCAECGAELGEYNDTTDYAATELGEYLEEHEDIDASNVECYDADIVETKVEKRKGRKHYIALWSTRLKCNDEVFKVSGEMAVTQDQFELFN